MPYSGASRRRPAPSTMIPVFGAFFSSAIADGVSAGGGCSSQLVRPMATASVDSR